MLSVSQGTHLVSIHFLVGSVRLNRVIATSKFIDKFPSLGLVARPNCGDFVNDIVYRTPFMTINSRCVRGGEA